MKRKLGAVLVLAWVLSGCATVGPTKISPLKGVYVEKPVADVSNKSFDEVWNNLIDVLAVSGFPIKLLDKENGLVVSERVSLVNKSTFEDKDGRIEDPNAYLVFATVSNGGFNRVFPRGVTGVANVRIRDLGNGEIRINPNLTSIEGADYNVYEDEQDLLYRNMRSTGVFEEDIIRQVK